MTLDLPIHVDDVPAQRWDVGECAATRRRLGAAAGARRLGIAIIEVDPGRRFDTSARSQSGSRWGGPRSGSGYTVRHPAGL